MDFSKLTLVFTAGVVLSSPAARAETIMRFRTASVSKSVPATTPVVDSANTFNAVEVPKNSLPVKAGNAADEYVGRLESPQSVDWYDQHGPPGHYDPCNPWAGYVEQKLESELRCDERRMRPWFWWLDLKLCSFDPLRIFRRNCSTSICCSMSSAPTPAIQPPPPSTAETPAETNGEASPPKNVLPRNELPRSAMKFRTRN